jgi:tetratricopeptide (TPR) repeat protein
MASEIALADLAGVSSSFFSKGKRFLFENANFSAAHLTELSGAIADEEYKAGQLKRAREAHRRALIAPNDNMISQAIEHRSRFGIALEGPQIALALANSHEAQVIKAWKELSPNVAELHAKAWHEEEPFSSRPIQFLSSLYLFHGDFDRSEKWIRVGLRTDSSDRGLMINQAFLYARAGRGQEMADLLRRLRAKHSDADSFSRATEGLFEYSQGRFDAGDKLYGEAVELFRRARRPDLEAYCRVFQALYADEFGHPTVEEIVNLARQPLKDSGTEDSFMLLHIRSQLDLRAEVRQDDHGLRRMRQLVFDPRENTLTIRAGLTARGAKQILIKGKDE